jgi:recombination protein RecR
MKYPKHLQKVIEVLKKLPGVGNKSAERFAFQMLNWTPLQLQEMAEIIQTIPKEIKQCKNCGCLIDHEACSFCDVARRDPTIVCVIASPRDVFAIEETHEFHGLYHVLGGLLSPMSGFGPEQLHINQLLQRIADLQIKEVVIALDSTLEGDATALYLKQELNSFNLTIQRLAFGLPMGSSLDYVDGGTLARAFTGRRNF